jgi:transposase
VCVTDGGDQRRCDQRTDSFDPGQTLASLVLPKNMFDLKVVLANALIDELESFGHFAQHLTEQPAQAVFTILKYQRQLSTQGSDITTACLLAELGDPARFDSPGAVASYVGVIPRIRQSGKKRFAKGPAIPLGNARLRKSLWMAVLQLIRRNAWLRQHYERLRAAGKTSKMRAAPAAKVATSSRRTWIHSIDFSRLRT